jgi:hypothetical protein
MTRKEVVDAVSCLDAEKRLQWLITLGWEMTISARAYYPRGPEGGSLVHIIAFNELQHQLFNYIRHSRTKDDWTIEQLVHGLCDKASATGVEGYFGTAIHSSVRAMTK